MSYGTSWNKLVSQYNKNRSSKEEIVQSSWEQLLSFTFDYSDTDIHPQFPVKMGVSTKLADILVRHGDDDLFVMELKRHTLHDGQEQLFSYLNQLKIETGVLVCDKLYVYDFDYTKKAENYSSVEIDFTQDNPDGIKFVELFTSDNFDRQKIKDFIAQKSRTKANATLIRKELTDDSVLRMVKERLVEKYPAEDVESVLSDMVITVRPKGAVTPAPVVASDFVLQAKGKKDHTQYTVNGTPTGGKGPTVYAAVGQYVKSNPGITFGQLQAVFPDEAAKPKFGKMIRLFEQVSEKERKHSFNKPPITLASGQQVVVSTQWNSDNMLSFIKYAGRAGITIESQ